MSKYSYEQRLDAVMNVVEKHMSCQSAAKLLSTAKEHVRRWVKFATKKDAEQNSTSFDWQRLSPLIQMHLFLRMGASKIL